MHTKMSGQLQLENNFRGNVNTVTLRMRSEWLCWKMELLLVTSHEGFPLSCMLHVSALRDQFRPLHASAEFPFGILPSTMECCSLSLIAKPNSLESHRTAAALPYKDAYYVILACCSLATLVDGWCYSGRGTVVRCSDHVFVSHITVWEGNDPLTENVSLIVFLCYMFAQQQLSTYICSASFLLQWAFGVTCWEVFSLGRTPYAGMSNHEIGPFLERGSRLSRPPLCPEEMWEYCKEITVIESTLAYCSCMHTILSWQLHVSTALSANIYYCHVHAFAAVLHGGHAHTWMQLLWCPSSMPPLPHLTRANFLSPLTPPSPLQVCHYPQLLGGRCQQTALLQHAGWQNWLPHKDTWSWICVTDNVITWPSCDPNTVCML